MKPYMIVLALLPMFAHADDKAAASLAALLAKVKSMSADFSQTTKGTKTTSFTGSMSMARPNKFRWDTKTPAPQLIVANGDTLWVYDKDLAQVTRQSAASQMGESPALLLSGDPVQIAKNFEISQPSAKNYYVLTPKAGANFKRLEVSFNGGRPVMMVLNDNLGQTTSIRFQNVSLNGKLPASHFAFSPPKGVDVIEQ